MQEQLKLYLTSEYGCSYLVDRTARNLLLDPNHNAHNLYGQLAAQGFRRSGEYLYRPHCEGCSACQSLRIPVTEFQPNRAQKRTWKRNQDITVVWKPAYFSTDHYRLFERYVKFRHPQGGMDDTTVEGYQEFITSSWSNSLLYEFRVQEKLLCVAVVDHLPNSLSAVYTFYDPRQSQRSLGTYAVLFLIQQAIDYRHQWLYLGYWISGCEKMTYKANFKPHQVFYDQQWHSIPG